MYIMIGWCLKISIVSQSHCSQALSHMQNPFWTELNSLGLTKSCEFILRWYWIWDVKFGFGMSVFYARRAKITEKRDNYYYFLKRLCYMVPLLQIGGSLKPSLFIKIES